MSCDPRISADRNYANISQPAEIFLCVDEIQIHDKIAIRDCSVSGKTTQSKMSCAPRISADRNYANIAQPAENYSATPTAAFTHRCLHSQKES